MRDYIDVMHFRSFQLWMDSSGSHLATGINLQFLILLVEMSKNISVLLLQKYAVSDNISIVSAILSKRMLALDITVNVISNIWSI